MAKKLPLLTRLFTPWLRKTLYDLYPELLDRQPMLRVSSEGGESVSQGDTLTAQSFYQYHMWLHKAVDVLAKNIAPLPKTITVGTGADRKYLTSHALLPLLAKPNPEQSAEALNLQWVTDIMLSGELGFEFVRGGNKQIVEMWPRQGQYVTVKVNSQRYLRIDGYTIDDNAGEPYFLPTTDFCFMKFYNPLQPFRGLSPVSAIRWSIKIDQMAQIWAWLAFKNGQRPDFAVVAPEGITPTEKKEILAQLAEEHGGTNAHKPIVLENGITDIKSFSFPPKDTEWLAQREMARDEVAAIIGVPDEMMGYGRDTYENFDTADRVMWTMTIKPLVQWSDGNLTQYFRGQKLLAPTENITTDLRDVPQLQENKTGKIDQVTKLWSMGVAFNKASEFVSLGLKVPGGDIGYLPFAVSPVGQARPDPAPITPPTEPMLPAEPPDDTPPDEPLSDEPAPAKSAKTKSAAGEWGSPEHEAVWKSSQARLDTYVLDLQVVVKKEFQRQQNDINRRLREGKQFGRGLYKTETIPPITALFFMDDEVGKFIQAFRDPTVTAVDRLGQLEMNLLGISGVFDISRPEVVEMIGNLLHKVSLKTNETTWTDLTQLFQDAETAGEGIPAIQERLSAYFGDRKSDYQTERIARTTMTGASNGGSMEAWRQSQVVKGKQWVSALQPGRTRDTHAEAHGQIVPLEGMFLVGGEHLAYPGDPMGSVGNIVNCLCTTIPVVEEQ